MPTIKNQSVFLPWGSQTLCLTPTPAPVTKWPFSTWSSTEMVRSQDMVGLDSWLCLHLTLAKPAPFGSSAFLNYKPIIPQLITIIPTIKSSYYLPSAWCTPCTTWLQELFWLLNLQIICHPDSHSSAGRSPTLESQLYHFLPGGPQTSSLTSLRFVFLICKSRASLRLRFPTYKMRLISVSIS